MVGRGEVGSSCVKLPCTDRRLALSNSDFFDMARITNLRHRFSVY